MTNQLLGTTTAAFAEGLVLGEALGLSRKALFEALLGGPAVAPFIASKRERIEKGDYAPADFPLRWLQKDLHGVGDITREQIYWISFAWIVSGPGPSPSGFAF